MDHSDMAMDEMMIEGAVHTKAKVNSFGEGTVNVSHDPIPAIGWPAMTMDMPLAEDAQMMGNVNVGDNVVMMLAKGEDGIYAVKALMPEE
ncbi:copper-binding protein [Maribius pontilimi]|uniref:Copper-binding protein n=2 Tax=Palleronia pontilimi TaxID=1964209 RepID=A0A934IGL9_9RHOB|nr:copper-binding protein [Palleronia pontilimi]